MQSIDDKRNACFPLVIGISSYNVSAWLMLSWAKTLLLQLKQQGCPNTKYRSTAAEPSLWIERTQKTALQAKVAMID